MSSRRLSTSSAALTDRPASLLALVETPAAQSRRGSVSSSGALAARASIGAPARRAPPRVRVAVRCRPPFEDEAGPPAVSALPRGAALLASTLAQLPADLALAAAAAAPGGGGGGGGGGSPGIGLHLCVAMGASGRGAAAGPSPSAPVVKREFAFDAVFGPAASNGEVYGVVGGPIVDAVLAGEDGAIITYGQTGSGKTHTLGTLSRVRGEDGLIPRSLSHIFGALNEAAAAAAAPSAAPSGVPSAAPPPPLATVRMSFAQLYLDTITDLLAPSAGAAAPSAPTAAAAAGDFAPPSLLVREDPARGFYVEGLTEYAVSSFSEALDVLNMGLERRILGATRMNATSSRSHTLLTVRLETHTPVSVPARAGSSGGAAAGIAYLTRRSQLVLVDLAGSERIRRTSSRGARLDEARAINASLHTLGQVIAAISSEAAAAERGGGSARAAHAPWRDAKLTKLLHGSLGCGAHCCLVATVAPAPADAAETLSTLLFAARCMRVTAQPLALGAAAAAAAAAAAPGGRHIADVAAHLQHRLFSLEAGHAEELSALRGRYDAALRELGARLAAAEAASAAATAAAATAVSRSAEPPLPSPIAPPDSGDEAALRGALATYDASLAAVAWTLMRARRRAAPAIGGAAAPASAAPPPRLAGGNAPCEDSEPSARVDQAAALRVLRGGGNKNNTNYEESADQDLAAPSLLAPPLLPPGAALTPLGLAIIAGDAPPAEALAALSAALGAATSAQAAAAAVVPPTLVVHPERSVLGVRGAAAYAAACLMAARSHVARLNALLAVKDAHAGAAARHLAAAEAAARARDGDAANQRSVMAHLVRELELARARGGAAAAPPDVGRRNGGGGGGDGDGEAAAEFGEGEEEEVDEDMAWRVAGRGAASAAASEAPPHASAGATAPPVRPSGRPPLPPTVPAAVRQTLTTGGIGPAYSSGGGGGEGDGGGGGDEDLDLNDGSDEIEAIVGFQVVPVPGAAARVLLGVRWRGAPADGGEDEYFSRDDLAADFPGLVRAFEAAHGAALRAAVAHAARAA